jgi:hypothetical protein
MSILNACCHPEGRKAECAEYSEAVALCRSCERSLLESLTGPGARLTLCVRFSFTFL